MTMIFLQLIWAQLMSILKLGHSLVMKLDPEKAHKLTVQALKTGMVPAGQLTKSSLLETRLPKSGLKLKSPVGLAAGFDKNGEVPDAMAKFGFGFVECGTVTPLAQPGNPTPRLFRLAEDRAVINRMGFNNGGLTEFEANLRRYKGGIPLGANVGANKVTDDKAEDYEIGIRAVYPICDYITINISSPNTPGLRGLQDKASLRDLLSRCSDAKDTAVKARPEMSDRPVFLKLAPDLDEAAIDDIVGVLDDAGSWLAGLIISNTTLARPETLNGSDKSEAGGLSGAPLFEPSTQVLRSFARRLNGRFDLIGAGGIGSPAQAYEKIKAGAHAVQLYSALVYGGIALVDEINRGLVKHLEADGYMSVSEAVGKGL